MWRLLKQRVFAFPALHLPPDVRVSCLTCIDRTDIEAGALELQIVTTLPTPTWIYDCWITSEKSNSNADVRYAISE